MPDTRPRNTEGQFSPESGGGTGPAAFQAAYNPAVIMQNNQQRQAILAAVNKRKQQVEGAVPSSASDTVLSSILPRLIELSARSKDSVREFGVIPEALHDLVGAGDRLAAAGGVIPPKKGLLGGHPLDDIFKPASPAVATQPLVAPATKKPFYGQPQFGSWDKPKPSAAYMSSILPRLIELSNYSETLRQVDNTYKHRAVMSALQGTQKLPLGTPPTVPEFRLGEPVYLRDRGTGHEKLSHLRAALVKSREGIAKHFRTF